MTVREEEGEFSMKRCKVLLFVGFSLLCGGHVGGQELTIIDFTGSRLTWMSTNTGDASIEWVSDPTSTNWNTDWSSLQDIPNTSTVMSADIPLHFRVVAEPSTDAILSPTVKANIQNLLDAAVTNYCIPGLSLAIKFFGEEPYVAAAGSRNLLGDPELLVPGDPMTTDARVRIGSATKTFTGMSAIKLISEEKLWLDQSLDTVLPSITNVLTYYETSKMTVRMLLEHTSGIASYTEFDEWLLDYVNNRTSVWTDVELMTLVNQGNDPANTNTLSFPPQTGTPGENWSYSNSGFVLLGMIVESITGTNIAQYIRDAFIGPLGLTDTFYPDPGETTIPGTFASGYMNWANFFGLSFLPDTLRDVTVYEASGVGAAGTMISTPSDLARWIEAIATDEVGFGEYNPGTHYSWRLYKSAQPQTDWFGATSYGLALAHESDPNNNANYEIYGHRGQLAGYDTAMQVLPDQEVALVLVCNRSLKNAAMGEPALPSNAGAVALNDIIAEMYPDLIADNQLPSSGTELQQRRDVTDSPIRGKILTEY